MAMDFSAAPLVCTLHKLSAASRAGRMNIFHMQPDAEVRMAFGTNHPPGYTVRDRFKIDIEKKGDIKRRLSLT